MKLDICAIEDEYVLIKAVAFEKSSLVIMRGMTALEATTVQIELDIAKLLCIFMRYKVGEYRGEAREWECGFGRK